MSPHTRYSVQLAISTEQSNYAGYTAERINETGDRAFSGESAIARLFFIPYSAMTDEELYTHNARDYAELAEVWARRSRQYANSIDLPAAMLLTIAINLLLTLILCPYVRR